MINKNISECRNCIYRILHLKKCLPLNPNKYLYCGYFFDDNKVRNIIPVYYKDYKFYKVIEVDQEHRIINFKELEDYEREKVMLLDNSTSFYKNIPDKYFTIGSICLYGFYINQDNYIIGYNEDIEKFLLDYTISLKPKKLKRIFNRKN